MTYVRQEVHGAGVLARRVIPHAKEGNAMRRLWSGSLGISLGLFLTAARADEYQWQPAARQTPAVTLGRPMPLANGTRSAIVDRQVTQASYSPARLDPPVPVVHAQSPDPLLPGTAPAPVSPPGAAPPPGVPSIPASPAERFNCGVVTEPPGSGNFLNKGSHGWFRGIRDFCGGLITSEGDTPRSRFQSDHGFDELASPVTNPLLFEDPRSLTELRPIFINQGAPSSNSVWRGGQVNYLGLQGRLALTERLSVVFNEIGWIWLDPNGDVPGFASHSGFAELRVGPKYTFYRCEPSGTVAAAGLTFDIPIGASNVFQDTGDLSLIPYVSVGQNFGRSNYGSFNFLGTLGYSVATDSARTDYLYTSLHLDYDVGNLRKIYPFLEFNYFHYTSAGNSLPLNFEGRDLINFGCTDVGGNTSTSMAVGARYKISEYIQFGGAYEFPVSGHRDLLDYRLTFDVIFRF